MTFTFSNVISPELSKSPLNDMIGNLLSGYTGAVHAKYAPQQQEADIFAKKIGPLATLATTPMFLQNPQFQAALGGLIAKNLHFGGGEFSGMNANNMPTYANQVNQDVHEIENLSKDLTKAGKLRTGVSSGAGWLENTFGDVGKHIADYFSKGMINSDLAKKENRLKDLMETLKNNEIQTQRLTPQQAEKTFTKRENETYGQMVARLKRTNPNLFQQQEPEAPGEPVSAGNSEMLLIGPDGSQGFVPADKAIKLIESGKFKEAT